MSLVKTIVVTRNQQIAYRIKNRELEVVCHIQHVYGKVEDGQRYGSVLVADANKVKHRNKRMELTSGHLSQNQITAQCRKYQATFDGK